ncbi:MFS transporter [Actinorhabdospora filicis]|uniref:MFS transporter n=1 Tax=Actinorhabdospora filicis TaxID=1785913 RepID=A0A9W6SKM6_9ACTN|nr:MFS transporter [Actinorhabdospora filicis]GLZ77409.1 MFS transporter [Actinorhabdospora filicis]
MRRLSPVIWILAANRFVSACAGFMMLFLFLYLTGPRGLSLTAAGVITGVIGAGSITGSFTGGWFSDRFGHRRVMLTAGLFGGLGVLLVPWLPIPVLACVLPLTAYAGSVGGVAQSALVAVAGGSGDRRTAIAVSRAASNAGFVLGPLIGAALSAWSYDAMFVIEGVTVLLVRQIVARMLPREAPPAGPREKIRLWPALRADKGLLTLLPAILVVDLVYRQLYSTLPVYLGDSGHGVGLYAALIAVGSGMILVLEIPVALWLKRLPATAIIGSGYALVAVGFAMFGLGTHAVLMVVAMLVLTAGEILYKTTASAHLADLAPPGLVARYQGLYSGLATSGVVFAAPVGALVYGSGLLWPLCGAAAGIAAFAAFWSGRRVSIMAAAGNPVS